MRVLTVFGKIKAVFLRNEMQNSRTKGHEAKIVDSFQKPIKVKKLILQ